MKALLPLAALLVGAAPADHPHSYLLSIGRIPLKATENIKGFTIETWGVQFSSVCHIPAGWRIKAGGRGTPDGEVSGEGSLGVTWFNQNSPDELHNLVLVTLYGPVQRKTIGAIDNGVPATFLGHATIATDNGDVQRPLTYQNVILTPARRCPVR